MDVGRNRVREAKQLYDGARDAYGKHRRSCYSCHAADRDQDSRRLCSTGWELAKVATRTYYALERARGHVVPRERGQQLELF